MSASSGSFRFYVALMILSCCSFALVRSPEAGVDAPPTVRAGSLAGESETQTGRQGYLVTFAVQYGRTRLVSAAEIDNYMESRHLAADDDWLMLLFDDSGECVGTRRITNPARYSPLLSADQELPIVVKIPELQGLAAVAIHNQYREEQIRIPLDASFKREAAANRQRFLTHDRANRRLLMEAAKARRRAMIRSAPRSGDIPLFEDLPADIQKIIQGEISFEIERLEQFGAEIMNLCKNLPVEPEEMERLMMSRNPDLSSPARAVEADAVFAANTIQDFTLEDGWVVSGTVKGDGGAAINRASVLLRQLNGTTTASPNWYANTNSDGHYTFTVPKGLAPNSFVISAYAQSYVLQSAGLTIAGDMTCDFKLEKGITVSGTVRDNDGKVVRNVRVRAHQGGTFISSALTSGDGTYAFDLPAGLYDLEALPPVGNTFAPVTAPNVSVQEPVTKDFVLAPAAGVLTINVYYPDEALYMLYAGKPNRFELFRSGVTVYATSGVQGTGGFDPTRGKFFRPYDVYMDNGRYALTAYMLGCRPITLSNIDVLGATAVSLDAPAPFLWKGVLRGADNAPLPGMSIASYNDTTTSSVWASTNFAGEFSILLTPNGFVKFFSDEGSNNILRTERIGDVTADRNEDWIFDAFPSFVDSGETLTQMYGVPDRMSRWNIVMIGDGYTGVVETFTDLNGNGQWDGVFYYDMNKNGLYDTGEPYRRFGNTPAPIHGTDPTKANEPFTDLNNDGVPNLRDQQVYDQNTLDTARSLFGQDEWQLHRDAFNIFRIRVISNQAGHDIRDLNGRDVISRDTALGAYLGSPDRGYIFGANNSLVMQYINQYVPEYNTRIVLVNQPIRMGRATSYIFQYGGEVPGLCNDYVIAHEMGHNVGQLADEYTEYQENYKGPESASRNITSLTDPAEIPWKYLITPGKEIPSLPGSCGVGLFEGAGYYTGGRYRPTTHCMMVSGNRYCPVCTVQIEIRLRDITSVVPDASPRAPAVTVASLYPEFSWDAQAGVSHFLFELEKVDAGRLVASYDVYDTSFTLPFALEEGAEYRWRIRPGSTSSWGSWSSRITFRPQNGSSAFAVISAQVAAGGGYKTTLTVINIEKMIANVSVSLVRSDGTAFETAASSAAGPVRLNVKPMGTARLETTLPGGIVAGYARLSSNVAISGTALFQTTNGNLVLSEAGVGLSRPAKNFTAYIDNLNDAFSGYAVANFGGSPANLTLTLRDAAGETREVRSFTLPAGRHFAEFAFQRFAAAQSGFEGSIEFTSDQDVAAVAMRYDNPSADVFSTIPVLVDEPATTLYFPQVAEGGGYRSNFILVNPSSTATVARLEFFSSDGTPLELPIGGGPRTSADLPLNGKGVARLVTDGTLANVKIGWVKVTCPVAITGSSIFQTRHGGRILSEAGVASSPLTQHFVAYVESLGSTESGLAICNPNPFAVTLTLSLRQSSGEIAATTSFSLAANGHSAKFFTEWFPRGFTEFEGTLEVLSTAPVSAVALRFDNPRQNVFAALPVAPVP